MTEETVIYEIGDIVTAINIKPLAGNTVAPPLELGKDYIVQDILIDKSGYQHLDVGLASDYNFITGYESREELKNGDTIHWAHPSRFKK